MKLGLSICSWVAKISLVKFPNTHTHTHTHTHKVLDKLKFKERYLLHFSSKRRQPEMNR